MEHKKSKKNIKKIDWFLRIRNQNGIRPAKNHSIWTDGNGSNRNCGWLREIYNLISVQLYWFWLPVVNRCEWLDKGEEEKEKKKRRQKKRRQERRKSRGERKREGEASKKEAGARLGFPWWFMQSTSELFISSGLRRKIVLFF